MVEAGALEALTKYLSLSPQDATEEAATDLLGILFDSAEIRRHESAYGAVNQLVAVLRLGGRNSRYSAAKALESLFSADHVRNGETARQAVQPLVEILNSGLEREQHAAIAALEHPQCRAGCSDFRNCSGVSAAKYLSAGVEGENELLGSFRSISERREGEG